MDSDGDRTPPFVLGDRVRVIGSDFAGRVIGMIPPAHPGLRWIVRVDVDMEYGKEKWVTEFRASALVRST